MEAIFNSEIKGLLHIDSLDALERKKFLRNVMTTAKRELAFIDVPECPSPAEAGLEMSVLTLFTIACKHDTKEEELRSFLTKLNLQTASVDDLLEIYSQSREDIQGRLAKYGHDIPWVTNVNWRLSSVIRSSGRDSGELVYKVAFEGSAPDRAGGRSIITTFDCTIEELQNLSAKFKEIERNCMKVAENK